MGLFDNMLGNATNVDPREVVRRLAEDRVLLPDEQVFNAFNLFRDLVVFTDWRIISVDVQGLTGKKKSYQTIPYSSISRFSVETAGNLDRDSELYIYISSSITPILTMEIRDNEALKDIQVLLATCLRKS
ncbi:PH domain-containing protein [Corynebacterium doosanense]|uniref:Helicase n=1 Tax=Corynebacterium doosanense CAU 212 = DSM 45436 TaxID=558173 RepID=A0A097IIX5_9CORY|nr:PH domain-containing protein [Corynebacterium doosanense]AIT62091.1 helicase [Corynebacterium doosanense CAU 212 = DSM 45436]